MMTRQYARRWDLMIDNESEFRQMSQQAQQQQYGNRRYGMEQSRYSNRTSQQRFVSRRNENGRQQCFDYQVDDRQQTYQVSPFEYEKLKRAVEQVHELSDISGENGNEMIRFFVVFDGIVEDLDEQQKNFWLGMKLQDNSKARIAFENALSLVGLCYADVRDSMLDQLGVSYKICEELLAAGEQNVQVEVGPTTEPRVVDCQAVRCGCSVRVVSPPIYQQQAMMVQRLPLSYQQEPMLDPVVTQREPASFDSGSKRSEGKAEATPKLQIGPARVFNSFIIWMPDLEDKDKVEENVIPFQDEPKIEDLCGWSTENVESGAIPLDFLGTESTDVLPDARGSCIVPLTVVPVDKTSAVMIEQPPSRMASRSRSYLLPGAENVKWTRRRKKGLKDRLGTIENFGAGQVLENGKPIANQELQKRQKCVKEIRNWMAARMSNWRKRESLGKPVPRQYVRDHEPRGRQGIWQKGPGRFCESPPRHLVNFRSPCKDQSRLNLGALDEKRRVDESVLLTADHTKHFGRQLGACWRDSSKLGA